MKHYLIIAGIILSSLCLLNPVMAQAPQTLTGTLSVEKNDSDAVVKATLTVGEETVYQIVLDDNGQKLAAALADKTVEVTGAVSKKEVETKDDDDNTVKTTELWLTVKSFKAVEEKQESTDSDE